MPYKTKITIVCEVCGKKHKTIVRKQRFCSLVCSYKKKPKKGVIVSCVVCGKKEYSSPVKSRSKKYCSYSCMAIGYKNSIKLNCVICNKEYERPASQVRWRGSSCCSRKCLDVSTGIRCSGEKNPSWNGGISRTYKEGFHSKEYKEWRKMVFERDNYTCQWCGCRNGNGYKVRLEPHHILRWAYFPEFRFTVSNGITLCKECHITTRKKDKLMQLVKYDESSS